MPFDRLKRRDFIALLSSAALWPLTARTQQPRKLPTIGFLGQSTRSAASEWTAAFVQRLRELGWIDGHNVAIEYRWGEGRNERFAEIAAEFVRLKVGSSNANSLCGQNSAGFLEIYASFQRDILQRHF
jgi:putative tryptophan/tyrosine transport system substrate-binding protein